MAVSIDERVVEMRFNNKQFEEGVKQSMNSLDNLDKSIDNLDNKNLNNLVNRLNAINFDAIERSVGSLEKRFSAFGIAGMTVVQDLTHGVEDLIGKMITLVNKPLAQIKSGGWSRAMNIENARFQLKGLKVAWDDISKDISYGVQDTAYGLDAAAKAASQLVASGVQFGETFGETGNSPMAKALRGISGVAAMSNSAYEEISPIFTTIAGQGKVMTMQLRQLESRGLNAAAELGKALGKTETEIREMVTKGKIDFQTFSAAMDDAFGQHAKDANETFEGSLSNMKAALSRIGADIGSNILDKMVGVFNDLRVSINSLHVTFQPFLDEINRWVNIGTSAIRVAIKWFNENEQAKKGVEDLRDALIATTRSLAAFVITIIKYSKPLHDNLKAINNILFGIIKSMFGLKSTMTPLQVMITAIGSLLKYILISLNAVSYVIRTILELLTSGDFNKIWSTLSPIAKIILPLIIGYLILAKFHLVKVGLAIAAIGSVIAIIAKYNLIDRLKGITSAIGDIADAIGTSLTSKFMAFKEFIVSIGESAQETKDKLKSVKSDAGNSVASWAANLGEKLKIIGEFFKGFISGVSPGITLLYALSAAFVVLMYNITEAVKNLTGIAKGFSPFAWLNSIGRGVQDMLRDLGKAEKMKAASQIIGIMALSLIALAAAAAYIANAVDPSTFGAIASAVFVLAAALGVLVLALGKVAKDLELTGFDAAATSIGSGGEKLLKELSKGAKALLKAMSVSVILHAFANSVVLVTAALVALAVAAKTYDIVGALKVLGAVEIGMLAFAIIMSAVIERFEKASDFAIGVIAFSASLAALAASLLIMAFAIQAFQDIKVSEMKLDAILLMVGTAIALGASVVVLSKVMKDATYNIAAFLVAAAGIALVLYQLPKILNSFANILKNITADIKDVLINCQMSMPLMIAALAAGTALVLVASKLASNAIQTIAIMTGFVQAIITVLNWMSKLSQEQIATIATVVENFKTTFVGIGVIIAGLIAVTALAKNALGAGLFLMSIPLSIIGMIVAFKVAAAMMRTLDIDSVINGIVGIGVAALAIFGLSKLVKGFSSDWKSLLVLPMVILALTVSIGALAALSKDNPASVIIGAVAISGALVALGYALGKMSKALANIKLTTLFVILGGLMGIIWTIGIAVKDITSNNANAGQILSALGGITLIIGAIAGVFVVLSKSLTAFKKVSGQQLAHMSLVFAEVGGALIAATAAIALLASTGTSWTTILNSALGISAVMLALAGSFAIIVKTFKSGSLNERDVKVIGATLLAMSVAMMGIAIGLSFLQNGDYNAILVSMVPLFTLFATILGSFILLSTMAKNKQLPKLNEIGPALLAMAALAGTMVILAKAMATVLRASSDIDFETGIVILTNLGLLFAELAGALYLFTKVKLDGEKIKSMLVFSAGIIALSFAIENLGKALATIVSVDFNPGQLLEAAAAISILVAVLTAFLGVMGALSTAGITIIGIAVAGLVLAGVFLSLGAATYLVSLGIAEVITALAELVRGMGDAAATTGENMDTIVMAIEAGIEELIRYVNEHAGEIGEALGKILDEAGIGGVGRWFNKNVVKGWEAWPEIFKELGGGFSANPTTNLSKGMQGGRGYAPGTVITHKGKHGAGGRTSDDNLYGLANPKVAQANIDGVKKNSKELTKWTGKSLIAGAKKNEKVAYEAGTIPGDAYIAGERDAMDTHSLSMLQADIASWSAPSLKAGAESNKEVAYEAGTIPGSNYVQGEEDSIKNANPIKFEDTPIGKYKLHKEAQMAGTEDGNAYATRLTESVTTSNAGTDIGTDVANNANGSLSDTLSTDSPKTWEDWVQLGKDVISGKKGLGEAAGALFGSSIMDGLKDSLNVGPIEDLISNIVNIAGGNRDYGKMMQDIRGTHTWKAEANEIRAYYRSINESIDNYSKIGDPAQRERALSELPYTIKKTTDEIDQIIDEKLYGRYEHDVAFRNKVYSEYQTSTTGMLEDLFGDILNLEGYTDGLGDIQMPEFDTSGITGGLDDTTAAVKSATDAFGEFDRTVTLTASDMLNNLKDNLVATREWEWGIQHLMKSGLSADIAKQFVDAGVDGSYQMVAAMNNALTGNKKQDKKMLKNYNTYYKSLKIASTKGIAYLEKAISKDGKKYNKKVLEMLGYTKDADTGKLITIGLKDWSKVTGKKLDKAYREAFGNISMKSLTKGSKELTAALDAFVSASTSKSEKATKAFKKYLQEAYLASLDEAQKQEFLAKKKKDQEKDITDWYKQQAKERKETVAAEIRAQGDLAKSYTKTGEEYYKELDKRNKSAKEIAADRNILAAMFKSAGKGGASKEILNELDDSAVLALLEQWMAAGGRNAGQAFYDEAAKKITGQRNWINNLNDAADKAIKSGDKTAIDDFVNKYYDNMTKLKDADTIYLETLTGIEDGMSDAIKKNKGLAKSIQNISKAFLFKGSDSTIEAATKALENYALTLIDVEAIQEEAAVTGADPTELIKQHLDEATKALKDFRNNVESSLKSTLQSFNKFDEGEKKSLDDMVKNLESNITKLNEWRAMIKKMQTLGYSKDLIEYMTSQGISSYAEVEALTSGEVTSTTVDHVNQMWKQVGDESKVGADEALGAVAIASETVGKSAIDGIVSEINNGKKDVTDSVSTLGTTAATAITNTQTPILSSIRGVVIAAKTLLKGEFLQIGSLLMSNVNAGLINVLSASKQVNMIKTLAEKNALIIPSTFKKVLGIHSPSKELYWIGEMCIAGLTSGFGNNAYKVEDEMNDLNDTLTAYAQVLADDLANTMDNESGWEIKPVLNLDDLQNANSLIQSLLGNGDIAVRSSNLAGQAAAQSEWDMLSKALSGVGTTETNNTYGDTTIVVNPPQGSNSREIAQMVMSEIQRQMDRRQRI